MELGEEGRFFRSLVIERFWGGEIGGGREHDRRAENNLVGEYESQRF